MYQQSEITTAVQDTAWRIAGLSIWLKQLAKVCVGPRCLFAH